MIDGLWVLVLFAPAILLAISEMSPNIRAARRGLQSVDEHTRRIENFCVIVPIWGQLCYLENVQYLSGYGQRVLLVTTTCETAEFDAGVDELAATYGFRVFRGDVPGRSPSIGPASKQTSGTIREHIVRDALAVVEAPYVVCIDADSETTFPLSVLVGALEEGCYDVASVCLVAKNRNRVIERLQAHEYRNAMRLRLLMPWLVSGACHVVRTRVHREIMHRHSTFFQGNDVEVGVLGDALHYRVGHIPFEVPTTVPSTWRSWFRQRLAWSGGEVRLFVVNLHLVRWHPTLFLYGFLALVTTPVRWYYLIHPSWPVAAAIGTYLLVMTIMNWRYRDASLLVMPLYLLLISLVVVPLGIVTYTKMAWADRKVGVIRRGRHHRRPGIEPARIVRA